MVICWQQCKHVSNQSLYLTNKIIEEVLKPVETNIIFDMDFECTVHPNTMDLVAFKDGKEIDRQRIYSVGGGTIEIEGQPKESVPNIYTLKTFDEIKEYCVKKDISLATGKGNLQIPYEFYLNLKP